MHIHGAPQYTYFYAYPMHIVELQFGSYKPLEGKGRNLKSKVTIWNEYFLALATWVGHESYGIVYVASREEFPTKASMQTWFLNAKW